MTHPQGRCPDPKPYRRVGDPTRTTYRLCDECRAIYEAAPFVFVFVPADSPEWVIRAAEHRLPTKVAA